MSGAIHGHDDHELDFVGSRLPGTMLGFRGLPVYHWWISWDFEIFQWNIVGYIYIPFWLFNIAMENHHF